jgi:uncharacterized membrane protein
MKISLDQKALSTIFVVCILIVSGVLGFLLKIESSSDTAKEQESVLENYDENENNGALDNAQKTEGSLELEEERKTSGRSARAAVDVGVVSISDIDKDELNLDHYPGTVVHLNVTIKNFGSNDITEPFQILFTISDNPARPPSWSEQFNRTLPDYWNVPSLKSNQSRNMSWNWSTPLNMEEGSLHNFSDSGVEFIAFFTTLLEGDLGSNNNQKSIKIKIDQPDFEVQLESGWPFWNAEEKDKIISIKKGDPNLFQLNFTLHNHGKGSFINYSVIGPTDWKVIPPMRKYYNDRSNSSQENLSLTIFPSVNLKHLPTATWLYIHLKAIAESYPLAFSTVTFRVKVRFIPQPYIEVPEVEEGEIYKIPPGEAFINFKVYNKGNGEDNFETYAQVGEFERQRKLLEKDGWRAVVHSGRFTRILKRGEYQVVTVKVTVPSKVRAGSPCAIKLVATSVKNPKHLDGEKNNTFYVFTDLNKDVSFVESKLKTMYMFPDSERSTQFKLRNTGNSADKTIRVNVSSIPEDWEVIIDSSDIPVGGLPRNGTADIEVTVNTPKRVVESTYEIKFAAVADEEIRDEISLPVSVLKVRKIALASSEAKRKGNVSERISFIVKVENLGNSKDSIDLRYSFVTPGMENMDWRVELSKNFTTLYPYESRDVIVSVFVPMDALADTNFMTPAVQEGYLIKIRGISQNDTTVVADKEIEVVVNPIYDFSFHRDKDTRNVILYQTTILDYSFKIENKGNIWDQIEFSYTTEAAYDGWISIPYQQRILQSGVTLELTVNFNIPETIGAGEYIFTLHAQSANKFELTSSLELTINIIESDLELTKIQIGDAALSKADVKEGETVLVRALLTNVGDLDYYNKTTVEENIIIKFMEGSNYIGEINISYLGSQEDVEENSMWVSHPWKVGKARTYTVRVELDPYDSFPETSDTNNELSGKVVVLPIGGKAADDTGQIESSDIYAVLAAIIIFIIIMLVGIWANIAISRRAAKKGYTVDGVYKPYEMTDKAQFDHDEDEEEEPEGGVLGVQSKHPYGGKKSDKFMKDVLSITTMKPIKKTKPIKKSKPLTGLAADGKHLGLDKPQIAGYLPPKSDSADDTKNKSGQS